MYKNTQEKLEEIMQMGGLTQVSLAQKLGVSFPTINSWLHEKSFPRDTASKKIDILLEEYTSKNMVNAKALKIKIDSILNKANIYQNNLDTLFERRDLYEDMISKLTYHSDGIEGSTLTLKETASIIFKNINIPNKNLIEQIEAKNHKSALIYLFEHMKSKYVVDESLLKRLHEILMNSILDNAGAYRYHPVRIVGSKTITANYMKIPDLMKELFKEFECSELDVISKASIFHGKFETIHPFPDGNGRVGRLILNAMLIKENIIPVIINQQKKYQYYSCLEKGFETDEYEHLIDFITNSINDTYAEFED
jgi:Fic family protein